MGYNGNAYKATWRRNLAKTIGLLGALLAIVSIFMAYQKRWTIFAAFFWTLVPPVWFYVEFYYLFDNLDDKDKREALKDRHELLRNVWAAVLALLAALYLRS
jgi:hypothetical protein